MYGCVTSHILYEYVMSHICMSHVMNECIMSHIGGCYILWQPSPSVQIETRKGFIPLCVSIREPVVDSVTRNLSRMGGDISHRYIFAVDGNAEG